MLNLADISTARADAQCECELTRCRIAVVRSALSRDEVKTTVTGVLGPLRFERAWYYWRVSGPVPIAVARDLYEDPVGHTDIRVAGHCGCPPPDEWASAVDGARCVDIDSEVGLRVFADAVRHWFGLPKPQPTGDRPAASNTPAPTATPETTGRTP